MALHALILAVLVVVFVILVFELLVEDDDVDNGDRATVIEIGDDDGVKDEHDKTEKTI